MLLSISVLLAYAFTILDYMWDTKAHPLTITVVSVLHELEYFGFSDVPDDAIDGSCASVAAAKTLAAHEQAYGTTRESLSGVDSIGDYEDTSFQAYDILCQTCSIGIRPFENLSFDQGLLNKCLTKYGIQYASVRGGYLKLVVSE